jgi:hypothetical protein
MTVVWTLCLLLAGAGLAAFSWWRLEQPPVLGEMRQYPAGLLLGVGLIVVIVALAHLVSLQTGVPLQGRMGF